MTNGNILSGIPSLIGTAGTIILGGVVIREIARATRPRAFRKRRMRRTQLPRLTNI